MTAVPRPEFLYVTPVIPALTGNGLAMRAGMVLEALAAHYTVSLRVMRLYAGVDALPVPLKSLCRRIEIVQPGAPGWFSRLSRLLPARRRRFHTVHVFRLAALPFAGPFLQGGAPPRLHLDLDDIESRTHQRLAALRRLNGDQAGAAMEEALARRAAIAEREAMARVDRLYVCSDADKALLEARTGVKIGVLPNAVRLPETSPAPEGGGPFRFLLIGTLGYYPNDDAVRYLCREIVPRLRERSGRPFECDIVGAGATDGLCRAAAAVGVKLRGFVPGVEELYRHAGAVVAPLRAGGGTRLKILEAFSYRRPVVSTTLGAEGIQARDEREILIADTPESFVASCLRLMNDGNLRNRLTENAFDLVRRCYCPAALRPIVAPFS